MAENTDELYRKIRELESQVAYLNAQLKQDDKFGLRWMDVPESFESDNRIPMLEEVKDKAINQQDGQPTHILIEGDNFNALTCLNYTHKGRIDVIYIDPPYNTGSDGFVYKDKRVLDKFPDGTTVPTDHPLRHSYWLSFMEKRLRLAKNLLSEKGVIFISIDDNEQANLKLLCDQVFGKENFLANLIWKSKSGGANDTNAFGVDHEYILCFAANGTKAHILNDKQSVVTTCYNKIDENGRRYALDRLDKQSLGYQSSLDFPITGPDGREYVVEHKDPLHKKARWRWGKDTVKERYDELVFIWPYVYTKNYEKTDGQKPRSILFEERFGRTRTGSTDLKEVMGNDDYFSYPKPINLLKYIESISANEDAIVLDFFAGSGTTMHATMALNKEDGGHRQCILVQMQEESGICEHVTYERNKRVMCGYKNAKGQEIAGLGGSMKYYRTDFVGEHNHRDATDRDRIALSHKAGNLLAFAENTLEEVKSTNFYQIFKEKEGDVATNGNLFTSVYFSDDLEEFGTFVSEIETLQTKYDYPHITVYLFCWDSPENYKEEFNNLRGISLKAIPQPILDIYKRINN